MYSLMLTIVAWTCGPGRTCKGPGPRSLEVPVSARPAAGPAASFGAAEQLATPCGLVLLHKHELRYQ